jgi:hypothetical protein
MTPEQQAALLPSKVLFEMWNALTFHLFERNVIDPARISDLLEERQALHQTENPDVAIVMQASIDWLKTLRAGEPMPPSTLH